jgi:hypothetical protein
MLVIKDVKLFKDGSDSQGRKSAWQVGKDPLQAPIAGRQALKRTQQDKSSRKHAPDALYSSYKVNI